MKTSIKRCKILIIRLIPITSVILASSLILTAYLHRLFFVYENVVAYYRSIYGLIIENECIPSSN